MSYKKTKKIKQEGRVKNMPKNIYERLKKGKVSTYSHKHYRFKRHSECRFCDIVHEQKEKIIFENDHIVVVFGRLHHKGHLVILTRTHEEHLMLMHEDTVDAFFNDTIHVCKALHSATKFDRLNMEYLDNWDPHIHWNIYPRFKADKDWGNPPEIPAREQKFKEQKMTKKEMNMFLKELKKRLPQGMTNSSFMKSNQDMIK